MEKFIEQMFGFPIVHGESTKKRCECWRPEKKSCKIKEATPSPDQVLENDLEDIVESVMHVMRICRLRPWEVRRLHEPIKRSFRHYQEIRYRLNRLPKKRFAKENFLHDAALIAGMTRIDGQLAYGIVKRAFRAYYHGTGEHGKRVAGLASQMRHRPECLWAHAACRTAEIFAVYAGLMYSEQKQYEKCIKCVYRNLYNELQSRFKYVPSNEDSCICRLENKASKQLRMPASATTVLTPISISNVTTEIFFNSAKMAISNATSATTVHMENVVVSMEAIVAGPRKLREQKKSEHSLFSTASQTPKKKSRRKRLRLLKCNCPPMHCDTAQPPPAPVITAECSQGPYTCRWLPFKDEEEFAKHHVPCPPMEVICPPCKEPTSCDEECTCTCQICTCPPSFGNVLGEEEHGEKLSRSGLEDHDTDYCWLAPFRDPSWPPPELTLEEEELPPSKGITISTKGVSTSDSKQLMFTYLKPFVSEPEIAAPVEPDQPVEELPPGRPCGITMETYRCWLQSSESVSIADSQPPVCQTCPLIGIIKHVTDIGSPKPKKARKKGGGTGRTVNAKKGAELAIEVKKKAAQAQHGHRTPPKTNGGTTTTASTKITSSSILPRSPAPATIRRATLTPVRAPIRGAPAATIRTPATATARPAASAPAPARPPPSPTHDPDRSSLTKEDIIKMLGLGK